MTIDASLSLFDVISIINYYFFVLSVYMRCWYRLCRLLVGMMPMRNWTSWRCQEEEAEGVSAVHLRVIVLLHISQQ